MSHDNERKSTGKAGRPPKQGDAAPATVLAVRLSVADQRHLAVVTERERARLRALGLPEGTVAKVTNGAEIVRRLLEQAAAPAAREPGAPSPEEVRRQLDAFVASRKEAAAAPTPSPAREPGAPSSEEIQRQFDALIASRKERSSAAPAMATAPAAAPATAPAAAPATPDAVLAWCAAFDAAGRPARGGQAALARLVGCDKSVINRWLKGRAPLPPTDAAALERAMLEDPATVRASLERDG